jgi:hypothetical protein
VTVGPDDRFRGRTWGQIRRDLIAEVTANGYVLPSTTAERQMCKRLVKYGDLVPNGSLGYRLKVQRSTP